MDTTSSSSDSQPLPSGRTEVVGVPKWILAIVVGAFASGGLMIIGASVKLYAQNEVQADRLIRMDGKLEKLGERFDAATQSRWTRDQQNVFSAGVEARFTRVEDTLKIRSKQIHKVDGLERQVERLSVKIDELIRSSRSR